MPKYVERRARPRLINQKERGWGRRATSKGFIIARPLTSDHVHHQLVLLRGLFSSRGCNLSNANEQLFDFARIQFNQFPVPSPTPSSVTATEPRRAPRGIIIKPMCVRPFVVYIDSTQFIGHPPSGHKIPPHLPLQFEKCISNLSSSPPLLVSDKPFIKPRGDSLDQVVGVRVIIHGEEEIPAIKCQ